MMIYMLFFVPYFVGLVLTSLFFFLLIPSWEHLVQNLDEYIFPILLLGAGWFVGIATLTNELKKLRGKDPDTT